MLNGEIVTGEANNAVFEITRRRIGNPWMFRAIAFVSGPIGVAIGYLVLGLVMDPIFGMIVGGIAALVGWFYLCRRLSMAMFRRKLARAGTPGPFPLAIDIGQDGLTYRIGGIKTNYDWSCVSELFRTRDHWVFLAQSNPVFAPCRYMAGPGEESAFVAAALSHMTPEAQARSLEAAQVAKSR